MEYINEILRVTESFLGYLEGCKKQISIQPTDSRIRKTISWLLSVQGEDGAWGKGDIASTSLTILAFHEMLPFIYEQKDKEELLKSIDIASQSLVNKYKNNRWEEAIWDTAVALRAIVKTSPEHYAEVQQAKQWLLKNEKVSNHGVHHQAQRLITLTEIGEHRDFLEEAANSLLSLVKEEKYHYSPYALSQVLEATIHISPKHSAIGV